MSRSSNLRAPKMAMAAMGALLLSVLALSACGESSQDKAHAEVCDARKSISEQVTKLQGMTLSSKTVEEAKQSVETIGTELKKIRDAQPNLSPARKQEVEAATSRFGEELKETALQVANGLSSGTSQAALEKAKPELKAALETLGKEYQQALGPVHC